MWFVNRRREQRYRYLAWQLTSCMRDCCYISRKAAYDESAQIYSYCISLHHRLALTEYVDVQLGTGQGTQKLRPTEVCLNPPEWELICVLSLCWSLFFLF